MTTKASLINRTSLCAIGDVHLLNGRNPTSRIVANLKRFFLPVFDELQYLQLNGDWLDKAGSLSDGDVAIAIDFLMFILQECDKHGIVVRVLEGTKSHDRGQLSQMIKWHERLNLKNDIRYISSIEIEHIESLGLTVLHIPDNLPFANADAAIDHIRGLMAERSLVEVDYAFCHGYFLHAVGGGAHRPRVCFDPSQFGFVKHNVLCSHVHTAGRSEHVVYTKSFDRLAHGEEDKKGFLVVRDYRTNPKVTFIENTNAMPFVTFDIRDVKADDAIASVQARLNDALLNPDDIAHIRVVHPDVTARKAIVRWAACYPWLTVTDIGPSDVAVALPSDADVSAPIDLLDLPTEAQLPSILFERLGGAYALDAIEACLGD